jgi:hypothetical protein
LAQEIEASRGRMVPDAVRIVPLPAAKVCQGPKRLQQRARGIFHRERCKPPRRRSLARELANAKSQSGFRFGFLCANFYERLASRGAPG